MSYLYSAIEVFEMAQEIERNGARFYRKASENIQDAGTREFILDLASMEDEHLRTFASMKSALSGRETESPTFDPNNEMALYLAALADTRVFSGRDIDTSTLEGIFKAALQAEKDSIAFYAGMKDLVPEYLGRGPLDAIIKEEMRHIRLLSERLAKLKP